MLCTEQVQSACCVLRGWFDCERQGACACTVQHDRGHAAAAVALLLLVPRLLECIPSKAGINCT
jgi:hypothetical protein